MPLAKMTFAKMILPNLQSNSRSCLSPLVSSACAYKADLHLPSGNSSDSDDRDDFTDTVNKSSTTRIHRQTLPVGRFAPSPTGELHIGSLTTAIASYCHIKSLGGRWLLRLEDTDIERCTQAFADQILRDLHNLGLQWDGEVVYQSQRSALYNQLLQQRLAPRLYGCSCSRKQLQGYATYPRCCLLPQTRQAISPSLPDLASCSLAAYPANASPSAAYPPDSCPSAPYAVATTPYLPVLPSTTLAPNAAPNAALTHRIALMGNKKIRVQLPDYSIGFLDGLQGMQWVNPQQTLGDVVLRRSDGVINYFLAVSIDDGLQGVTHVMRGLDILPLTTAQIALMDYLQLPAIEQWLHLPLVENHQGQKLSKQNLARPIATGSVRQCQALIQQALNLLGQPKVDTAAPSVMLAQAVAQWRSEALAHQHTLGRV